MDESFPSETSWRLGPITLRVWGDGLVWNWDVSHEWELFWDTSGYCGSEAEALRTALNAAQAFAAAGVTLPRERLN